MTLWLTSDTHYGHASVIGYAGRPFDSVGAMDEALVERWNALVRPKDEVWHLGDFSLGPRGTAGRVFSRLHGRKHLLAGNHDGADVRSCDWLSVSDLRTRRAEGVLLVLCHYPMLSWHGSSWNRERVGSIMCHGHVHGTPADAKVPPHPCRADVGVDMRGYAPVPAEAIVEAARVALAAAGRRCSESEAKPR